MKNQAKRLLSVFLAVIMLLSVIPVVNGFAAKIIDSGRCGNSNVTWTLDSNGKVTIGGSGRIPNDFVFTWCYNNGKHKDFVKSYYIGKDITSIDGIPYFQKNLTDITVDKNNKYYLSQDGVLFNKSKTRLLRCPDKKSGKSYNIPSSVRDIDIYAFWGCSNLENITIPYGVPYIGEGVFQDCTNLKSITIPKSVTVIGEGGFAECRNLRSITLPKDMIAIGVCAFGGCSGLKSITIPNKVTSIGEQAFWGCTGLTNVVIPDSVTMIDRSAFYNCTGLRNVTISKNVTDINEMAFGYYYDNNTENYAAKVSHLNIYGYKNTAAEKYAQREGFNFIDLYTHTHSYKSAVTKKATCKANGIMKYTCDCGYSYTKAIKANPTAHTYATTTTKGTLSKDGSTVTKCKFCQAVKAKSTIAKIASVKLSKTSFTYNGKTQRPSVVVKDRTGKTLKNGTDYTVKYSSGCQNVGQYSVTITFNGKYSGTKTLVFKIVPKGTSISKLTAGKKQFTAKWSAQTAQTTGYELQYSTKSSMSGAKTVTVGKNKTTSAKVKKLKGKKKYYARVRTYKIVKIGGKNVKLYSSWSKVKSVKTK